MHDPVTGAWVVTGEGRLSKQEAVMVREAVSGGQEVVFANRHQWRHFQVRRV